MQKMQEIPSLGQEEGMATHSSILAWKIPMDRGAWRATVRGITKSQTRLNRWVGSEVKGRPKREGIFVYIQLIHFVLPWWLRWQKSTYNAGNLSFIPSFKKSPGEGNGYPLQYS